MTSREAFNAYLDRAVAKHGDKLDTSELYSQFVDHYQGERIEVTGPMGKRRGRVSITTGWRPAFLLMHRRGDHGSWDILSAEDRVTAVIAP